MKTHPALRFCLQRAFRPAFLPTNKEIKAWAIAALLTESQKAEVTFRVVGIEEGREFNKQYRGKNEATNVLTFTLGDTTIPDLPLIGDIVLCAPVIEREAAEQDKSLNAHYCHLVIHAMLHLQGFDHVNEAQADQMEALEIELLSRFGYANPYEDNKKAGPNEPAFP